MTFKELAVLQMEVLSKQSPITLKEAKAQVLRLKRRSCAKNKKKRPEKPE